jgi:hypothetical protein
VQGEARVEQRGGVGGDEHRGVADRLDEPHRRARAVGRELGEALGHLAELGRRQLLAERREADEVGERDADLARRGQRPGRALVGAQRLGALGHAAPEHADGAQHLLVAHAGAPERGGGADRRDVEVGERGRVGVGHRQAVRAAHRLERLEREVRLARDVAGTVPRRAVDEPLGEQEGEQAVRDRVAQLVDRGAVGVEALEELQAGRSRLAVEAVEEALRGEVHPHPG